MYRVTSATQQLIAEANAARAIKAEFTPLIKSLRDFDWFYSYSDSGSVYRNGEAGLKAIKQAIADLESPAERDLMAMFCREFGADVHRAGLQTWRELPPEYHWYWYERLLSQCDDREAVALQTLGATDVQIAFFESMDRFQGSLKALFADDLYGSWYVGGWGGFDRELRSLYDIADAKVRAHYVGTTVSTSVLQSLVAIADGIGSALETVRDQATLDGLDTATYWNNRLAHNGRFFTTPTNALMFDIRGSFGSRRLVVSGPKHWLLFERTPLL